MMSGALDVDVDGGGDEIVISGISGRFPESADMNEFMAHLYTGHNMVTVNSRRFKPGLYGVPQGFGTLSEIDRFDADAFGILPAQVRRMCPGLRVSLETVYEALGDAGVDPASVRGSATGVFLGLCTNESMTLLSRDPNRTADGLAMIGSSNSMFANRISYAFDFKGPSSAYDTACSTSTFALAAAVASMRAGECDAAVVTASTLILTPLVASLFKKLGMLSPGSACKSFDKGADGFARAESVVSIYLQRASVAKRIYASILSIGTNTDGYKEGGITAPSVDSQEALLRSVYSKGGVDMEQVSYIEAHGTGTKAGDPVELLAIQRAFGLNKEKRRQPLLIGSVKSNMGHSEGASGLCSLAKVVIMLQRGIIPANLHYKEPGEGLDAIRDGLVRVVSENTEWGGGLIGLNSFGFGGVNTHLVLKPHNSYYGRESQRDTVTELRPRLIAFSGRNVDGVTSALTAIRHTRNTHLFTLVNELANNGGVNSIGPVRGVTVYRPARPARPSSTDDDESKELLLHVSEDSTLDGTRRPLWFVFNGMGSQWWGMGRSLLRHSSVFRKSVHAVAHTLRSRFGYELLDLLDDGADDNDNLGDAVFDSDPTAAFVSIAAVQLGLVDVLQSLGLVPDGLLGHSAGEMAAAYADGALTAEEVIVMAYLRGESVRAREGGTEPGGMAVVGLPWDQVTRMCPPRVYPACHNGAESVTVSGADEAVKKFVAQLTEKRTPVFARFVNSCGVAFHSPLIARASASFLTDLRAENWSTSSKQRARSSRWISTSVAEAEWGTPLAQAASPEYFVNNFLSPVLFHEACAHIPRNAVVVEIGPSGLLQGLIKKAVGSVSIVVSLQTRQSPTSNDEDKNVDGGWVDLLNAIGRLYTAGLNFNANGLLSGQDGPPLLPVPLGTPFLSSFISSGWDHSTSWEVPSFGMNDELQLSSFVVDTSSSADSFLVGHSIQGRVLYPATGLLTLVWRAFALSQQLNLDFCPVVFENVRFIRMTVLRHRDRREFTVQILRASSSFEVREGGDVVVTGKVRAPEASPLTRETRMDEVKWGEKAEALSQRLKRSSSSGASGSGPLTSKELYKNIRLRGMGYSGAFCSLTASSPDYTEFLVCWTGNWVTFLDACLQTVLLYRNTDRRPQVLTSISKLVIEPGKVLEAAENNRARAMSTDVGSSAAAEDQFVLPLMYDPHLELIKAHGVELHWGEHAPLTSTPKEGNPTLGALRFTPYIEQDVRDPLPSSYSPLIQVMSIALANLNLPLFGEAPRPLQVMELTSTAADFVRSMAVVRALRSGLASKSSGNGSHALEYTLFAPSDLMDPPPPSFATSGISRKPYEEFEGARLLRRKHDIVILQGQIFLALLASQYLKKGSFLVYIAGREDAPTPERLCERLGTKCVLVAVKHSEKDVVFVFRRTRKELELDLTTIIRVSSISLDWLTTLQAAIADAAADVEGEDEDSRIILVGSGSDCGLHGLMQCLRKEPGCRNLRAILTEGNRSPEGRAEQFSLTNLSPQMEKILRADLIMNVFDATGRWGTYDVSFGLSETEPTLRQTPNAFVGIETPGDLTTLRWVEGPGLALALPTTQAKEIDDPFIPIQVHYASLNFKDVMLATGRLPATNKGPTSTLPPDAPGPQLGFEFAGLTVEGDRVCGYNDGCAISTHVLARSEQLWTIPERWTLVEAATVPVVYLTAFLALEIRGQLQEGESILIHSGTGGVGQAAIRLALSKGCSVFTTVGSLEKREWVLREFPDIPPTHIGFSRDTTFETLILTATKGRGVDVVLNSLSGAKLDASIRCLARHGRFLEIGKSDLMANRELSMQLFLRDASFHGVMLDSLHDAHSTIKTRLRALMKEGIGSGLVHPLPYRVFNRDQVEPALRYMGMGKHIGKVLIEMSAETHAHANPFSVPLLAALPRVYFSPTKSYVVIGGLGGLGLEFVDWMLARGARSLLLVSRSGAGSADQAQSIAEWRKQTDVNIRVLAADVSNEEGARAVLEEAETNLGPLDGIFNLAGVLELGLIGDQNETSFRASFLPKVDVTRALDVVTRADKKWSHRDRLSHFVVFSSVVAGFGMPGQANYGMANSAAEGICRQRVADGLAGKAVQLGPIGDTGMFYEMYLAGTVVSIPGDSRLFNEGARVSARSLGGFGVQSVRSLLNTLDVLFTSHDPVLVSAIMETDGSGSSPAHGQNQMDESLEERLARILGTDLSRNPKRRLTELGLDSIMAMEVRQLLDGEYGLSLSASELRALTLEDLTELSRKSGHHVMSCGGGGGSGRGGGDEARGLKPRAPTSDLYQFNFLRVGQGAKIFYKQCVYPLNSVEDTARGSVFICNSIEGPQILRILGELIRRPAYSMQFPRDIAFETWSLVAEHYIQELRVKQPKGPYVIAGYSAGVYPAIEMALQLQVTGEVTKLVLIDMAPGRSDAIVRENMGKEVTELEELDETEVLVTFMSQMLNVDKDLMQVVVDEEPDRNSKLLKLLEYVQPLLADDETGREILETFLSIEHHNLLSMFHSGKPSGAFHGDVVLVRTTQNLISFDSTPYWGLEQFCTRTPKVVRVNSTHSYIVAEPGVYAVADAINND